MNTINKIRFNGWASLGLAALERLKECPNDNKARIEVDTAAACCAEYDRKHEQEATQTLQSYVWEQGYLSGECSYERYERSGYFKEKYRKVT